MLLKTLLSFGHQTFHRLYEDAAEHFIEVLTYTCSLVSKQLHPCWTCTFNPYRPYIYDYNLYHSLVKILTEFLRILEGLRRLDKLKDPQRQGSFKDPLKIFKRYSKTFDVKIFQGSLLGSLKILDDSAKIFQRSLKIFKDLIKILQRSLVRS